VVTIPDLEASHFSRWSNWRAFTNLNIHSLMLLITLLLPLLIRREFTNLNIHNFVCPSAMWMPKRGNCYRIEDEIVRTEGCKEKPAYEKEPAPLEVGSFVLWGEKSRYREETIDQAKADPMPESCMFSNLDLYYCATMESMIYTDLYCWGRRFEVCCKTFARKQDRDYGHLKLE